MNTAKGKIDLSAGLATPVAGSGLFRALMERSGPPTFLVTLPDGIILEWNSAAKRLFKFPSGPVPKPTLTNLFEFGPGSQLQKFLNTSPQSSGPGGEILFLKNDPRRQSPIRLDLQYVEHAGAGYALASCDPLPPARSLDGNLETATFLSIFDSCPIPLCYTTPEGVNLRINRAFAALSGFAPDEVVGHSALELHLWHSPEERALAQALLKEEGKIDDLEATMRKKDGSTMTCQVSTRFVTDTAGRPRIISAVRDITRLKVAEKTLQSSEALFRDFFMSNPVATIITSPDGTIHMVNPEFINKSGYTEGDVVGKTSQELGFWQDPADRERMVAAVRERGYIDNLEASFFGKHQRPMTCVVSSRAVEFNGELRILSTVLDITEKKKAEQALKELDQAKSDFIAMAAHELRTPLMAIIGYAELLDKAHLHRIGPEQRQSYVTTILNNAESLSRHVEDMMDIERIQRGKPLHICKQDTPLAGLFESAIDNITLKCPEHRFNLTHATDLPETLFIDGGRIIQVLQNLLDNAVKYSPTGGQIDLFTATGDDRFAVTVSDHGMGMTEAQVAQIFDRFYRAAPLNPRAGGLGLGMCIVKQIIEEHNGEIEVSSQPRQGTTITFTLPIRNREQD